MARAATATINLDALRHNYRVAKSVAPTENAIAVIKANGYGHNAVKVAEALAHEADAFAVACIEEAVELRQAGITNPILLLEGFFEPDELKLIDELNLWCTVHSQAQIQAITTYKASRPLNLWLKLDSGMHRLGIAPEAFHTAYQQLIRLPHVNEVVLMTHLSSADNLNSPTTQAQIDTFETATNGINAPISLANSAGLLAHPASLSNWQRPGIMLYGASPFNQPQTLANKLQPVMTLTSEVIAVRNVNPGDAIGYSGTWVCEKPTRVGTVAMGYADGYPRHAKNGTPVIVNGHRTTLIGRVSMDMLTVDLTDIPSADIGSPVELWGENLSAGEVSQHCDTIAYTLFTGITSRVHKRYI